ncbi:hypothetical protein DFR88_00725 [Metallosphaera sedula]|nr:hypothetical protein DFR88_00725 [Metallosphaera prunae]BBL47204.1 CRISPR-associated endoribonuclease Cas6 [Metallosphaera sedula]
MFTNDPAVVFFVNVMEVTGLPREKLCITWEKLGEWLWPEPSLLDYIQVTYAGKVVTGMTGKLRYSLTECADRDSVKKLLENAVSRGIGTSRRNGFGRVEVRVR